MIGIRPIRQADIDSCYLIVQDNWNEEAADRFLGEVSQVWSDMAEPPIYYVAEMDGCVVGFAGMMRSWIMYGVWDFIWINIKKEFQQEGVGKRLTEFRLKEVLACDGKAVHLMTRTTSFFEQFGFSVARDYGDWKLMTLWLGPLKL